MYCGCAWGGGRSRLVVVLVHNIKGGRHAPYALAPRGGAEARVDAAPPRASRCAAHTTSCNRWAGRGRTGRSQIGAIRSPLTMRTRPAQRSSSPMIQAGSLVRQRPPWMAASLPQTAARRRGKAATTRIWLLTARQRLLAASSRPWLEREGHRKVTSCRRRRQVARAHTAA